MAALAWSLVFAAPLTSWPQECDPKEFSSFDTPPQMKSIYSPISDAALLEDEVSGRVEFQVFVRADRSLCNLVVRKSSNDTMLSVCRENVEKARFSPAQFENRSVDGQLDIVFWLERSMYDRVIHQYTGKGFDEIKPFIADLAVVGEAQLHTGETKRVFIYENVAFIGDISTSRYRELLRTVENELEAGEAISEIWTTLLAAGDHRFDARHDLEYLVVTERPNRAGYWKPGRKFRRIYDGCTYRIFAAVEIGEAK